MAFNFNKNTVVGVSVHPELGLEVAQIDYSTKTVLKYIAKPLAYNNARREITDMDIFKETLSEALSDLDIPKGSDLIFTLPSVCFNVVDYPASLSEEQVQNAIEEELTSHPIFQNTEGCISATALPNSTIQFTKVAYTVSQKVMLIELAIQVKELGYHLVAIDTSVNATLNSLIYNERVDISPNNSWVLFLVENTCCRVLLMQGRNYVDCIEEQISIGEVLGDAENYATVVNAVNPILKNIPSNCLYIVSKTNLISAKVLADKLTYNAPIVHQESNIFAQEAFLPVDSDIDDNTAKLISFDVIGAAIYKEFSQSSIVNFNLYNASLGDVYILEQPPIIKIGSKSYELSVANMTKLSVICAIIAVALILIAIFPINVSIKQKEERVNQLQAEIAVIQRFLDDNPSVSSNLFDEGDEIRVGLTHNRAIYSYYSIVGTEIPKKLWLTYLNFDNYITIEGQADNLESIYSFFRNIKDYSPESNLKLQKLGLATRSKLAELTEEEAFDTSSILTSMNADFYEFKISNAPEEKKAKNTDKENSNETGDLPTELKDLEPIEQ